jgi:hypothetical protein
MDSMQRIFIKKCFLFTVGCLSHKAVHNRVDKLCEGCSEVADDARPGAKLAETTTKRLLSCGFLEALVKQWDKCINVGGGYVEK